MQPTDPAAWVSHTAAMTNTFPIYAVSPSLSTVTSIGPSITSSNPDIERLEDLHLCIHSDMAAIVKAMASPESGLEICSRMGLKITILSAFVGSDVGDWLALPQRGRCHWLVGDQQVCLQPAECDFIRHTVNKVTFSDQCYYICDSMASVSLHDHDGFSRASE